MTTNHETCHKHENRVSEKKHVKPNTGTIEQQIKRVTKDREDWCKQQKSVKQKKTLNPNMKRLINKSTL